MPFAFGTIIYVDKMFIFPAIVALILNTWYVWFAKESYIVTKKLTQE